MASDYGRNFGFRRSDESMRVSEGRFRTPAADPVLLMGTAVEIDPTDTDNEHLRVAAADAAPRTGICGLLLQEENHIFSIYDSQIVDSYDQGRAKKDTLSVITNGPGTKVWFKNTGSESRLDGRSIAAVTMVDLTGVTVGDELGWDGTKWVKVDGTTITNAFMEVTKVDTAAGFCEATLLA